MANVSHIDIDGTVYDITPASPVSVGNGTLTIQKNGANVQTFSANQNTNATANITVPVNVSELNNDSGYTTNTGTVTQVKVGTSAYNPTSGVVSLPAYPTVNNATLTIQKNGTNVQTFTANQSSNATANISVPTKVSELTNDSGYTTNTGTVTQVKVGSTAYNPSSGVVSLPAYPTVNNATLTIQKNGTNVQTFTANQGSNATANITVPTKVSQLTNDSGYTTNTGTVTQVKVGTTAYNPSSGVVSLPAYPSVGNGTLTIQRNGSNVATFTANQGGNATANIAVPTKVSDLTNDNAWIAYKSCNQGATVTFTTLNNSGYHDIMLECYMKVSNIDFCVTIPLTINSITGSNNGTNRILRNSWFNSVTDWCTAQVTISSTSMSFSCFSAPAFTGTPICWLYVKK